MPRIPRLRPAAVLACCACLSTLTACGSEAEPRPPAAPTGVTAQSGTATTVHVMWTRAKGDAAIDAYEILESGKKVKEVDGQRTMVDVTGLKPSAAYEFSVRTRDEAGNRSAPSREIPVTTLAATVADTRPPGRPATLTGAADGSRAATLRWGAAADDQKVVSYDIYQGDAKIHTVDGRETEALLTGLRPATSYVFTVRARDAADNASPPSPALRLRTGVGSAGGGAAPIDFRAASRKDAGDGAYYLDLSWTPPKTDGLVAEYQIHLDGRLATTLVWGGDAPKGRAKHTFYVTREAGETYAVKIRPRLPDGTWGAFSTERRVTTGG
ncbi:fibronectin type III domain-containing protein [Streptomyces sp. NPDC060194]|uniref:fibronectin type III domain-containing protein n=1 Tax=Streptomyces sp. NPDC060194 TaxID=3347069 RepID=UPI00364BB3EE